jgi:hypothetical protein
MNPIARFMKKLSILFGQERFASELEEEMAFHRAQLEEELIAGGMTLEAARYAATQQFGNATKLRRLIWSCVDGGKFPARTSRSVGEPNGCVASGATMYLIDSELVTGNRLRSRRLSGCSLRHA